MTIRVTPALEDASRTSWGAGALANFPDEAIEPYARLATAAFNVPMAAVFLRSGDELKLRVSHGIPPQPKTLPHFFKDFHALPPRVYVNDVDVDSNIGNREALDRLGWRSFACIQFGLDNGATGMFCVADNSPRAWSAQDGELLVEFAGLLVTQVRREVRMRADSARQILIEQARRQSEERYRRLFESSRDAIYMTTQDGSFADANNAMLELFGYSRVELLQRTKHDVYVDPTDFVRFQKELERVGSIRQHEVRFKRKDGTVIDCLMSASVQRGDDGTIIGYQGIIIDITERKQLEAHLAHSAFHDSLTGLPNRALYIDRLERLVRHAKRRPDERFGVLFLDLDRFKIVNDTLGHAYGDALLVAVARRLELCVRAEDTVARFGGDEFAVLLDSIRDSGDATRVAERILLELSAPFKLHDQEVQTHCSVGIALNYTGSEQSDALLRDADRAMYRAKTSGRGRYEVFDPQQHRAAVQQLQIESELRRALQQREFVLVYQPVIDLQQSRLAGFEAFVRWRHPQRGMVGPSEFIAVAEETGLILQIGWWVLEEACRQIRHWEIAYPDQIGETTVSVNLSGRQFYQSDLIQHVDEILHEAGATPERLRLEVSERDVMANAEASIRVLSELRARGINISVDDFGTGFSSLSYLQRFSITTLKIDRSFVQGMQTGGTGLVNSILALGRSLGVTALAEGVETAEEANILRTLGTRYAQGYFFSEPVDADRASRFIETGWVSNQ
jgi:diguanylate cyclase (GGDEF)-like protein/PAS domain S-box-containing protein